MTMPPAQPSAKAAGGPQLNSNVGASVMTSQQANNLYGPRRSAKTTGLYVAADGAVWKERLTVCEGVTAEGHPKLTIRSYFRNPHTQERVWDEPPSGASNIVFATAEMRQQAEQQRRDMQATLDQLPPDVAAAQHQQAGWVAPPRAIQSVSSAASASPQKKKKGIFGRLKKTKERPTLQDESKDLNLQRAIAQSMADQHYQGTKRRPSNARVSQSVPYYQAGLNPSPSADEDDMAMAKALSMSEYQPANGSDEQVLQWALEQSRQEAYGVTPLVASSTASSPMSDSKPSPLDAFDPYSPAAAASQTPSTTPANSSCSEEGGDAAPPSKSPLSQSAKLKVGPARRGPRLFGSRKRMEAKAGVL